MGTASLVPLWSNRINLSKRVLSLWLTEQYWSGQLLWNHYDLSCRYCSCCNLLHFNLLQQFPGGEKNLIFSPTLSPFRQYAKALWHRIVSNGTHLRRSMQNKSRNIFFLVFLRPIIFKFSKWSFIFHLNFVCIIHTNCHLRGFSYKYATFQD